MLAKSVSNPSGTTIGRPSDGWKTKSDRRTNWYCDPSALFSILRWTGNACVFIVCFLRSRGRGVEVGRAALVSGPFSSAKGEDSAPNRQGVPHDLRILLGKVRGTSKDSDDPSGCRFPCRHRDGPGGDPFRGQGETCGARCRCDPGLFQFRQGEEKPGRRLHPAKALAAAWAAWARTSKEAAMRS